MPLGDLHGKSGADAKSIEGGPYFTADIIPLLAKNCGNCHGPGSAMDWTNYETFKSKKDRILVRVLGPGANMPIGGKLSDTERALLQAWIDNGMAYEPGLTPKEPTSPEPQAPVSQIPVPVQSCVGCHGERGESSQTLYPKLALQTPDYLTSQLQAFRSKARASTAARIFMWLPTENLTDDDISIIAAYFSNQPATQKNTPGPNEKILLGQSIYNDGLPGKGLPSCAACHGAEGQGIATMPRLAGQHKDYLVKQLGYFKTEERVDSNGLMSGFAKLMSEEDIVNVSEYLNSL